MGVFFLLPEYVGPGAYVFEGRPPYERKNVRQVRNDGSGEVA